MKAKTFDKAFDNNEDISAILVTDKARRGNKTQQRVNVDFPVWMLEALDAEGSRLGVTRLTIIKVWLAERLQGLPTHP